MAKHASLLAEMKRALLAEFGARAIYRRLTRYVRDEALARVLASFAQEEDEVIASLREVMTQLGARPRRRSLRRLVLANTLALTTFVIGPRFALRICADAEETRSRWYAEFHEWLLRQGEEGPARACARLCLTKQRHAQALQAWVQHAHRHGNP